MFVNKLFNVSRVHISKCIRCFNVKSSTYYFYVHQKILEDFQFCINVPLNSCDVLTIFSIAMIEILAQTHSSLVEQNTRCVDIPSHHVLSFSPFHLLFFSIKKTFARQMTLARKRFLKT